MFAYGRQTTAILLLCLLALVGTTTAEDLAAQARAAKGTYRPLDQSDLVAARADLDAAVADLERRFGSAGESAQGWKEYLDWVGLQQQLARPEGPELERLEQTYLALSAGHEGLGLIWFTSLRDAIRRYVGVARGVDDPNIKARFEKVIDALAAGLDSFSQSPNGEDAAMISAYLRWLSDARQAPELIESIRSASLDRNFHATVSVGLLDAAMGREVDQTDPVRDNILGTSIHGTGRTTGEVSIELVPSQDRATIKTVMRGTNVSNTTGYNGPVIIHADGVTELTTQKQILIDSERLWTLPALADAVTHSNIRSICARNGMRIVENMAWKRARKQKCQADAIAAQHAEWQAQARFDEEVDSLIGPANDDIQGKVRRPLLDRGLYPTDLNYSTDESCLYLSILQAGEFDLGATTAPPEAAADADIRIQVHESMVNNFTSSALAGMLLREERVQEAVKNMFGELPKELESEEGSEPWAISFQPARPVWAAFEDGRFTISIRGRSFYEGETRHPGMDVTVSYQLEGEGENVKAVRQGEVEIFPPGFDPQGDKQLSAQQTAIRRILQRRLGKLFEEEIVPEELILPEDWRRAGKLKVVQWEVRDGWLVLSWKRTGEPAPAEDAESADVAMAR